MTNEEAQAIRRQALEEAAALCDEKAQLWWQAYSKQRKVANTLPGTAASACAMAIRELMAEHAPQPPATAIGEAALQAAGWVRSVHGDYGEDIEYSQSVGGLYFGVFLPAYGEAIRVYLELGDSCHYLPHITTMEQLERLVSLLRGDAG